MWNLKDHILTIDYQTYKFQKMAYNFYVFTDFY
jgi:hypothetical protein